MFDCPFAYRPTDARAHTTASVTFPCPAPSQAPEGRHLDWEEYNHRRDEDESGVRHAGNSFAALMAGTSTSAALLHGLSIPDAAVQAPGMMIMMIMANAVQVSYKW